MGATMNNQNTRNHIGTLPTYCWNQINEPGCYLFTEWGCLARVPSDGVVEGRSPRITFYSGTNPVCCKLSDDPYISVSQARQIAADHDYPVGF